MSKFTYAPKKTAHLLHLILTIITVGFWIPIWITAVTCNTDAYERLEHVEE